MFMHAGPGWVLGASNNGDWGKMADFMREMMGPYKTGGGYWFWQFHWLLELVTWLLIIAFLAAAVRWLWKKGDKK